MPPLPSPNPSAPLIVHSLDGLYGAVEAATKAHGPMADLNHIDVSHILIFDGLFEDSEFNGNISQWNTSNAKSMRSLFRASAFNGDISKWNVSDVLYMQDMFNGSAFTGNLAKWRPKVASGMSGMFQNSVFDGDISKWNPAQLKEAVGMFTKSPFSGDVSKWRLSDLNNCGCMFDEKFCGKLPLIVHDKPYTSYAHMLGGVQALNAYAARTPFSQVHASMLLDAPQACSWASQEVVRWALAVKEMGRSMGMDDAQLRTLLVKSHQEQAQATPVFAADLFDSCGDQHP